MSWFERQARGRDPDAVSREHGRYLRAAGVDRALEQLAGPFGVRRFLLHFEARGARVRVRAIDAIPLAWGGGPPPPDPTGGARKAVEVALTRLHLNMSTGPRWGRGAASYLRDARGDASIQLVFDDDADDASLDLLPMPPRPGHPLEVPETRALVAHWEPAMAELHAASARMGRGHDAWEIQDDRRLLLHFGGDPDEGPPPTETRRRRCQVLGTFDPRTGLFTWRTDGPLFDEKVFGWDAFPATWAAATELALLAAARLGAAWLLVEPVGEHGMVLMAAVFD